jgi:hypothetical protein
MWYGTSHASMRVSAAVGLTGIVDHFLPTAGRAHRDVVDAVHRLPDVDAVHHCTPSQRGSGFLVVGGGLHDLAGLAAERDRVARLIPPQFRNDYGLP